MQLSSPTMHHPHFPPLTPTPPTHFGQQDLHLQIGETPPQAHSCPIAVRQRRKRMDGLRVGRRRFQPAFRFEFAGILTVSLHAAGDDGGENDLDAFRHRIAADDGVLLQCAAVADDRAVDAAMGRVGGVK